MFELICSAPRDYLGASPKAQDTIAKPSRWPRAGGDGRRRVVPRPDEQPRKDSI